MADLKDQFFNQYRLTTAQIFYRLPDHKNLLQEFIWQDYDLAPKFPALKQFLGFWTREIEGPLHSVYVEKKEIITPGDTRFANWELSIH